MGISPYAGHLTNIIMTNMSNNANMACLKLFEYTENEIKEGNQKRKKQTEIFNFLQ